MSDKIGKTPDSAITNVIADAGKDHQWLLKPLGGRSLGRRESLKVPAQR